MFGQFAIVPLEDHLTKRPLKDITGTLTELGKSLIIADVLIVSKELRLGLRGVLK